MAKRKGSKSTYTWAIGPGGLVCYKSTVGGCTVVGLWEAGELTTFHDAELAKATRDVNSILSKIEKNNRNSNRELAFIEFQNRHFLVWVTPDVVGLGPDEDEVAVRKALKLKAK